MLSIAATRCYGPGMNDTLITRREAADRASVGLRTVDRWLAEGRLTRHKDGLGRVTISPLELDELTTPRPVSATGR